MISLSVNSPTSICDFSVEEVCVRVCTCVCVYLLVCISQPQNDFTVRELSNLIL